MQYHFIKGTILVQAFLKAFFVAENMFERQLEKPDKSEEEPRPLHQIDQDVQLAKKYAGTWAEREFAEEPYNRYNQQRTSINKEQ